MTHTLLQSELRNLVAATLLDEVLQKLSQVFKNDSDKLNDITLFYTRHNLTSANYRKGLIEPKEHHQQVLQLANSILNLIGEISEEEATAYELENSIFTKILVVCKNEAAIQRMDAFFDSFYFKNVDYTHHYDEAKVAWCDLIVFDFLHACEENPAYHDLLTQYLRHSPKYILYFGRFNKLLEQYPMKAYFTNSPFSLYARLRELIDFMKYYQARSAAAK